MPQQHRPDRRVSRVVSRVQDEAVVAPEFQFAALAKRRDGQMPALISRLPTIVTGPGYGGGSENADRPLVGEAAQLGHQKVDSFPHAIRLAPWVDSLDVIEADEVGGEVGA